MRGAKYLQGAEQRHVRMQRRRLLQELPQAGSGGADRGDLLRHVAPGGGGVGERAVGGGGPVNDIFRVRGQCVEGGAELVVQGGGDERQFGGAEERFDRLAHPLQAGGVHVALHSLHAQRPEWLVLAEQPGRVGRCGVGDVPAVVDEAAGGAAQQHGQAHLGGIRIPAEGRLLDQLAELVGRDRRQVLLGQRKAAAQGGEQRMRLVDGAVGLVDGQGLQIGVGGVADQGSLDGGLLVGDAVRQLGEAAVDGGDQLRLGEGGAHGVGGAVHDQRELVAVEEDIGTAHAQGEQPLHLGPVAGQVARLGLACHGLLRLGVLDAADHHIGL